MGLALVLAAVEFLGVALVASGCAAAEAAPLVARLVVAGERGLASEAHAARGALPRLGEGRLLEHVVRLRVVVGEAVAVRRRRRLGRRLRERVAVGRHVGGRVGERWCRRQRCCGRESGWGGEGGVFEGGAAGGEGARGEGEGEGLRVGEGE